MATTLVSLSGAHGELVLHLRSKIATYIRSLSETNEKRKEILFREVESALLRIFLDGCRGGGSTLFGSTQTPMAKLSKFLQAIDGGVLCCFAESVLQNPQAYCQSVMGILLTSQTQFYRVLHHIELPGSPLQQSAFLKKPASVNTLEDMLPAMWDVATHPTASDSQLSRRSSQVSTSSTASHASRVSQPSTQFAEVTDAMVATETVDDTRQTHVRKRQPSQKGKLVVKNRARFKEAFRKASPRASVPREVAQAASKATSPYRSTRHSEAEKAKTQSSTRKDHDQVGHESQKLATRDEDVPNIVPTSTDEASAVQHPEDVSLVESFRSHDGGSGDDGGSGSGSVVQAPDAEPHTDEGQLDADGSQMQTVTDSSDKQTASLKEEHTTPCIEPGVSSLTEDAPSLEAAPLPSLPPLAALGSDIADAEQQVGALDPDAVESVDTALAQPDASIDMVCSDTSALTVCDVALNAPAAPQLVAFNTSQSQEEVEKLTRRVLGMRSSEVAWESSSEGPFSPADPTADSPWSSPSSTDSEQSGNEGTVDEDEDDEYQRRAQMLLDMESIGSLEQPLTLKRYQDAWENQALMASIQHFHPSSTQEKHCEHPRHAWSTEAGEPLRELESRGAPEGFMVIGPWEVSMADMPADEEGWQYLERWDAKPSPVKTDRTMLRRRRWCRPLEPLMNPTNREVLEERVYHHPTVKDAAVNLILSTLKMPLRTFSRLKTKDELDEYDDSEVFAQDLELLAIRERAYGKSPVPDSVFDDFDDLGWVEYLAVWSKQFMFTLAPSIGVLQQLERYQIVAHLASQESKCPGCGADLVVGAEEDPYLHMRLCFFTGKFYCFGACMSNDRAIIPARVFELLDFNEYPVCRKAATSLDLAMSENIFSWRLFRDAAALFGYSEPTSSDFFIPSEECREAPLHLLKEYNLARTHFLPMLTDAMEEVIELREKVAAAYAELKEAAATERLARQRLKRFKHAMPFLVFENAHLLSVHDVGTMSSLTFANILDICQQLLKGREPEILLQLRQAHHRLQPGLLEWMTGSMRLSTSKQTEESNDDS
eukprot:m.185361 g.185361  ORF g.185361 m.185361 type:complete len:1053 (+) comp14727_c2_seq2:90-3248(+)